MKSELVFRKPLFYVIAAGVAIGCYAAFIAGAISNPNGSLFFGAVIFTAFVYFFWLIGWQSAVRASSAGIIIDNLLYRNYIPWAYVLEIKGGNGLLIVTRSGERIGSLMYGGSLIGIVTGSIQSRAVASKLKNVQEKVLAGGDSGGAGADDQTYRSGVHFQAWPILVSLATMELIAGVAYALR